MRPHLCKRLCPSVRRSVILSLKTLKEGCLKLLNEDGVKRNVQGGSEEHQGGRSDKEQVARKRNEGRGGRSYKEAGATKTKER